VGYNGASCIASWCHSSNFQEALLGQQLPLPYTHCSPCRQQHKKWVCPRLDVSTPAGAPQLCMCCAAEDLNTSLSAQWVSTNESTDFLSQSLTCLQYAVLTYLLSYCML
jgi:hypothetical protein